MTLLEQDIKQHVIDNINNYIGTPISDLHHELFNTDYWVVGYWEAEKEISKFGSVFRAIEKIKEYEEFNFGECTTDVSSSEKVCNMLTYILGEECLHGIRIISNHWDGTLTENIASEIIDELS